MPSRILAIAVVVSSVGLLPAAVRLDPPEPTVGQNLQTSAAVRLDRAAPEGGMEVTVESDDASKVLLAASEKGTGTRTITLSVPKGWNSTPEFFIRGIGESGPAPYSIKVPGEEAVKGAIKLTHSAIVVTGPSRFTGVLSTTTGAAGTSITVYTAQIDPEAGSPKILPLRGDWSLAIAIKSSDPKVGTVEPSRLSIRGGEVGATGVFQPAGPGTTALNLEPAIGFNQPSRFSVLTATVALPGLGLADEITIGKDLQVRGNALLGEIAAGSGVTITLTSSDPKRLLLSPSATEVGSGSLTLKVPAGGIAVGYYLQALSSAGDVAYTAAAPGYRGRTATVHLAPSGLVIVGPEGPPDEAEFLRPNAPVGPHKMLALLSRASPEHVRIYPVYLDSKTLRGADITVQPVRAGITVVAKLTNSDSAIGTVSSLVTISGGLDQGATEFIPRAAGTTVLSVTAPEGFTKPTNATELTVVVRP